MKETSDRGSGKKDDRLPDFFVVGAWRCGTTSLHQYFRAHPEIYVPVQKELNFFALKGTNPSYMNRDIGPHNTLDKYLERYNSAKTHQIKGEVAPMYLLRAETTIENIQAYYEYHHRIPIIIILRDPIDRLRSHYTLYVQNDREKLAPYELIKNESKKKSDPTCPPWHYYVEAGKYADPVSQYCEQFDQVNVFLFDEMKSDLPSFRHELFSFLGVSNNISESEASRRFAVSGVPRSPFHNYIFQILTSTLNPVKWLAKWTLPDSIQRTLRTVLHSGTHTKIELPDEIEQQLREIYDPDRKKLERIIDRDLSHWL